jgi:hypothetical protein
MLPLSLVDGCPRAGRIASVFKKQMLFVSPIWIREDIAKSVGYRLAAGKGF